MFVAVLMFNAVIQYTSATQRKPDSSNTVWLKKLLFSVIYLPIFAT